MASLFLTAAACLGLFVALVTPSAAIDPSCYALVGSPSLASPKDAPVVCNATTARGRDTCFLLCGLCTTPDLLVGADPSVVRVWGQGGPTSI
jgi:hypothetical protein